MSQNIGYLFSFFCKDIKPAMKYMNTNLILVIPAPHQMRAKLQRESSKNKGFWIALMVAPYGLKKCTMFPDAFGGE